MVIAPEAVVSGIIFITEVSNLLYFLHIYSFLFPLLSALLQKNTRARVCASVRVNVCAFGASVTLLVSLELLKFASPFA